MCGFAGWIDYPCRFPLQPGALAAVGRLLAHRGPDGSCSVCLRGTTPDAPGLQTPAIGLVHCMLGIQDPGPSARQPAGLISPPPGILPEQVPRLCRPDQLDRARWLIVYNGEIYNTPQIRSALATRGFQPTSGCDTELFLAAVALLGTGFLRHIEGMFAAVLIDRSDPLRPVALLLRDRFGQKPLCWSMDHGLLLFASEPAALHLLRSAAGLPSGVDPSTARQCMFLRAPLSPRCGLTGAQSLPPGSYLRVDGLTQPVCRRWFRLPIPRPPPPTTARPQAAPRAGDLLPRVVAAVRRSLAADVPIGLLLSGGVDSACLATAACLAGHRLPAYTLSFPDNPSADESAPAAQTARHLALEHHIVPFRQADAPAALADLLGHLNTPLADSSLLALRCVCRHASAHAGIRVLLGGDGGDELLGSYRRLDFHRAGPLRRLAAWLTASLPRRAMPSRWQRLVDLSRRARRAAATADPFEQHVRLASPAATHALWLLSPIPPQQTWADLAADLRQAAPHRPHAVPLATPQDRVAFAAWLDAVCLLPADMLAKADAGGMAFGVELRSPLLDLDIVHALWPTRRSGLHPGLTGKQPLLQAFSAHLPDHLHARPKRGFEIPLAHWLRTCLRDLLLQTLTPARLRHVGLCDPAALRQLFNEHCSGHADHAELLFAVLIVHAWADRIDQLAEGLSPARADGQSLPEQSPRAAADR